MPDKKAVIWLNSTDEIADKIKLGLEQKNEIVNSAQNWFKIINQDHPEDASIRIWENIEAILNQRF